MLTALFAKSVTCVNPFIYTLNQPKNRIEILRRLQLLLSVNPQPSSRGLVTSYNPSRSTRRPDICCSCSRRMNSQRHPITNNWRSSRCSPRRALEPDTAVDNGPETAARSTGHLEIVCPINNDTLYYERKDHERQHHSIQQSIEGGDGIIVERSSMIIVADLNDKINKKVPPDDAVRRCNNSSIDNDSSNEQSITDTVNQFFDSSRISELVVSKTSLLSNTELYSIDGKSKETLV